MDTPPSDSPGRPAYRPDTLNPERLGKILKNIADGLSFKTAAEVAGSSRTTAHRWHRSGEDVLASMKETSPDVESIIDDWLQVWPSDFLATNGMWDAPMPLPFTNRKEWLLTLFAVLLPVARSQAEANLVKHIRKAGKHQWQASAWLLERRNPAEFGRNQTIAHTGPDGGAVQIEAASSEEVLAKIAEFRRMKAEN